MSRSMTYYPCTTDSLTLLSAMDEFAVAVHGTPQLGCFVTRD